MKNIEIACASCSRNLVVVRDGDRTTVHPCAKCLKDEWAEAYDLGYDAGYDEALMGIGIR